MPYQPQPLRAVLKARGITVRQLAERSRIDENHIYNVMHGRCRPCPEFCERVPFILRTPLDELLTPNLLDKPYDPNRGRPRRWAVAI